MTTKTLDEHIVITPGVVGGKPRIAGRGIAVQNIVAWHTALDMSVAEIADEYDLSLADVHAALAYYYDHKAAIDAQIRETEEFVAAMRRQTPAVAARENSDQDNGNSVR